MIRILHSPSAGVLLLVTFEQFGQGPEEDRGVARVVGVAEAAAGLVIARPVVPQPGGGVPAV